MFFICLFWIVADSDRKAITFNDFLYVKMDPQRSSKDLAQSQLTGVNILDEEHPFVEIGGWSSGWYPN